MKLDVGVFTSERTRGGGVVTCCIEPGPVSRCRWKEPGSS